MGLIEIVDEAGNVHGPFAMMEEAISYVESRALGEQRDDDDERSAGWYFRAPRSAA